MGKDIQKVRKLNAWRERKLESPKAWTSTLERAGVGCWLEQHNGGLDGWTETVIGSREKGRNLIPAGLVKVHRRSGKVVVSSVKSQSSPTPLDRAGEYDRNVEKRRVRLGSHKGKPDRAEKVIDSNVLQTASH